MVFAIHWHESAMDLHVFPILIPTPSSLPTPSLWVFPVHQSWALVSCIQPGLVICSTLDNVHVSMLFSQNISPSSSPPESKILFCTSVAHTLNYFSVQFSPSVMSDSLPPHESQHNRPPCPSTISRSLPELMSIELVMPSSHLILCRPLLLLPSIFPTTRVSCSESALLTRWPKDWSFSFSISPSNEHPWLISFSMDWLDLLSVQGALRSLLQHHSSKTSIHLNSAFFTVQLSHPYMTTGKNHSLD